ASGDPKQSPCREGRRDQTFNGHWEPRRTGDVVAALPGWLETSHRDQHPSVGGPGPCGLTSSAHGLHTTCLWNSSPPNDIPVAGRDEARAVLFALPRRSKRCPPPSLNTPESSTSSPAWGAC